MSIRFTGLWRHSDFLKLWTGQTVSRFGSTIIHEVLPLTALLVLGATPVQKGLLAAVGPAPVLLVELFAGVRVDRWWRRPLMIAADLTWAFLLLSIPLAVATALIVASQFVGDAVRSAFGIGALSIRQTATPDRLLGRVNSSMYLMAMGFGPLGAAVGGYLGGAVGVRETLALAVLGSALGSLWLIASPVRTLQGLPDLGVSHPGTARHRSERSRRASGTGAVSVKFDEKKVKGVL